MGPGVEAASPLLTARQVTKTFGGLTAVNKLDIDIQPGEIRGLVGPNGSGKTTFLNLLTGFCISDSGSVTFRGVNITRQGTHRRIRLGLGRSFQSPQIFRDMTALENVFIGSYRYLRAEPYHALLGGSRTRRADREGLAAATEVLEFAGLSQWAGTRAGSMPYGAQKSLDIARALSARPSMILMDEPAAGLNSGEAVQLTALCRRIRDRGITILIIEHNMRMVMSLCDRVTVLDHGVKIAEGTAAEVEVNERVQEAYLGRKH